MIQKGQLTVIDFETYTCIDVVDGYAHLKNVLHEQGRPKKLLQHLVPYFNEQGEFIEPKQPKKKKYNSRVSLNQLIRNATDMPISHSFTALLHEWLEGAITDMVAWSEANAITKGHHRISAQHVYWWELSANQDTKGYWPTQEEYVKEQ